MGKIYNLIQTAGNEIGYLEKANNTELDSKTANAGKNNYTKYWRDLKASGFQGQPWCLCFVDWCFAQTFGVAEAKKLLNMSQFIYYTPTAAQGFKNAKQWYKYPKVGDIVFFKNSQRICHVGIVYRIDQSKVYTIEGNTNGGSTLEANGGAVAKKSYPLTYAKIAGYGRPDYKDNSFPPVVPASDIKKGKKGPQAAFLQQCLNFLGANLEEDGDFGPKSEQALINFQNDNKLVPDGEYGPKSRAAMCDKVHKRAMQP